MSIRIVAALAVLVLTPTLAAAQKPPRTAPATPTTPTPAAGSGGVALRLSPTFEAGRAWLRYVHPTGRTMEWRSFCFECTRYVPPGTYDLGVSEPPARRRRGRARPPTISAAVRFTVEESLRLQVVRDSRAGWRGLGDVLTTLGSGGLVVFFLATAILGGLSSAAEDVTGVQPAIPMDILGPLLAVGGGGAFLTAVGIPLVLWNDHYEVRPIAQ